MNIKTKIFQDMIAKAIKGASNNKMIPITSLMGIELNNGILTLMTTDGSNHLRIKESVTDELDPIEGTVAMQKFYTVVNAEMLAKLVAKTTSEYIVLKIENNYLEVKGNGKYKLDIPVDEDGNVIKFTSFKTVNGEKSYTIGAELLKKILGTAKVSIAKTMEVPCLTGYYLSDKSITTDRETMCCINKPLFDEPILISSEMAELLQLLDDGEVTISKEENKLLFETKKAVIYGKQLEGLETYPVQALAGLMNLTYDNIVKVNKQELLDVLDRMNIFVSDYDKNGVFLSFTEDGLQMTSQKSNASEIIAMDRDANKDFVPFRCLIDILIFQSQVQTVKGEVVEICYGQEKSIKLLEDDTVMIMSLSNNENN